MSTSVPTTPQEFLASALNQMPWYYSVEVFPGLVARGSFPDDLVMLPRLLARHADVAGRTCLDIGSMEGLLPVLLARRGAARVVATDAIAHCAPQMEAIKQYYGVDFEFAAVGLLYDLHRKLAPQCFDFVNFSGVLYHVYSPLMALAAVRSLVRPGGLMVVSTNIVHDDGYRAEFNAAGRLQPEANTFWYLSVPLLDYMLRMLRLAPIDCLHFEHAGLGLTPVVPGLRTGYMSVLCRASDERLPTGGDEYLEALQVHSWEFNSLTDWAAADSHPRSTIRATGPYDGVVRRDDLDAIDLWASVQHQPGHGPAVARDAHQLHLDDWD
jgi:2-polyprenyl-3-methyl-5-hydroxy-6-metoxy-1,4-benzoquinol methylase